MANILKWQRSDVPAAQRHGRRGVSQQSHGRRVTWQPVDAAVPVAAAVAAADVRVPTDDTLPSMSTVAADSVIVSTDDEAPTPAVAVGGAREPRAARGGWPRTRLPIP